MTSFDMGSITYSIFDPTGNVTALVETEVPVREQPAVAASVQKLHRDVEQVGFVRFGLSEVYLRMAGGEFCGNATMSAAALHLIRTGKHSSTGRTAVTVCVEGTEGPLKVSLKRDAEDVFEASLMIPCNMKAGREQLIYHGNSSELLCVRMDGINHLILDDRSDLYELKNDQDAACNAVRSFCEQLGGGALGLMFLESDNSSQSDRYLMVPLVFVPGSDTLFWEHSCASGTAACGYALAKEKGASVDLAFDEPGGRMRVCCDPVTGELTLYGHTRLIDELS